jgi:hypothetical protein
MRRVLIGYVAILLVVLVGIATAYLTPGGPGGGLTTLEGYLGAIGITGNSGNGTDQITGIANLNTELWANNFSGVDIGAKVNAAIASPAGANGAIIHIPPGVFSFSTTIQCPVNGGSAYVIEGAGMGYNGDVTGETTVLKYTGSTAAINQFINVPAYQNAPGCKFRDFALDGSGASGSAIGIWFGGTSYTTFADVMIQNFPGPGVLVENAGGGMYTERYDANRLTLHHNDPTGIGPGGAGTGAEWEWLCDAGCQGSFGHFALSPINLNLWSTGGTNVGFGTTSHGQGALVYDGVIDVNGNSEGTVAGDTLFKMGTSGDTFNQVMILSRIECNSPSCRMSNFAAGSAWDPAEFAWLDIVSNWTNIIAGAGGDTVAITNLNTISPVKTNADIWAGSLFSASPPPSGAHSGEVWSMRDGNSTQGLYGFGNGTVSLDYSVNKASAFSLNGGGLYIGGTTFAGLGAPANGEMQYCFDCTLANPCAGGGTGAIAKRLNSVWVCN